MSTTRTTRILKFVASILGVLLLGYIACIAKLLWDFRTHTYTIHGVPAALTDDATAMRLSESALRLHGADPAAFTPGTYWGGVTVVRNELDPNRAYPRVGFTVTPRGPVLVSLLNSTALM